MAITVRVIRNEERSVGLLGEVSAGQTVVTADVCWTPRYSQIFDCEEFPLVFNALEVLAPIISVDIGEYTLFRRATESEFLRVLAPIDLDKLPAWYGHMLTLCRGVCPEE